MPAAWRLLQHLLLTPFRPDSAGMPFLDRAETYVDAQVELTVAVPDAKEGERLFGISLARHGLQGVYVRVVNRSAVPVRLQFRSIDPHYYPPLEAAAKCHFSIIKRLSAFGAIGWLFLPLLLIFVPLKLLSVSWANQRLDDWFQQRAFHRRPIPPGGNAEGFVYTPIDAGSKLVRLRLMAAAGDADAAGLPFDLTTAPAVVDHTFVVEVPGIQVDHRRRELETICPPASREECDTATLIARLQTLPPTTTNRRGTGSGDPVNLVVVGEFPILLQAFAGRWDETETISLKTCWKTVKSFLLGSSYRYSPVSNLYLFSRSQDVALQQSRRSISERLHLRLWLAPLTLSGESVWVGQISRDIGVRFTTRAWNLTTHRIDADIDESRDYVFDDLLAAGYVRTAGYVGGGPASTADLPHRNLTGDPYYSDGQRLVIVLAAQRIRA